jgi:predicted TIM-barrel fold metal-dependent hydrolase
MRAAILSSAIAVLSAAASQTRSGPLADHHQHLFSPPIAALISVKPISADDLIPLLDTAGIARAAVLSTAYMYGNPSKTVEDEYDRVKAENDWTGDQVARFSKRLLGFCGFNPLKEYAIQELERCARNPHLRHGLKLHFGNSVVDYHNPQHVARLKEVFAAANRHGMAVIVHMRASISRKLPYGRGEALIFLNDVIPAAPDVPVQIAHLAGAGGYGDPLADEALAVFAEAIEKGDPRTRRLWFDVTTVVLAKQTYLHPLIAKRIRQLGVQRILYGSDASSGSNTPGEGWAIFRKIPLTDTEFETIAANVAPYMR